MAELEGYALAASREVFLQSGTFAESVDIQLGIAATVTGTVVNPDNQPLRAARVSVSVAGIRGLQHTDVDAEGRFRFEKVPPGEFVIRARVPGLAPERKVAGQARAGEVTDVRVVLHPVRGVTGRVQDPAGRPVPDAAVFVRPTDKAEAEARRAAFSDDQGAFWLQGPFEADRNQVWAVHPNWGPSQEETVPLGVERVILVLTDGGRLSGRVVSSVSGEPVGRYKVQIAKYQTFDGPAVPGGGFGSTTVRDPEGRFEFESLSPGIYGIRVHAAGYTTASVGNLRVQAGRETSAGTIVLTSGASLTGRVVDAHTGEPLQGARVRTMVFRGLNQTSITDARGSFRLANVSAERLTIQASRRGYLTELVSGILPVSGTETDMGIIRLEPVDGTEPDAFKYAGMGAVLKTENGRLWITEALESSPASLAGIQPGTEIVRVDGYDYSDLDLARAVELIRGEPGTQVVLDVVSPGASHPQTVRIERSRIRTR
jgi:protocatechuate 3,4-dioxygenase beta subunit